jgi:hypothetical protein
LVERCVSHLQRATCIAALIKTAPGEFAANFMPRGKISLIAAQAQRDIIEADFNLTDFLPVAEEFPQINPRNFRSPDTGIAASGFGAKL